MQTTEAMEQTCENTSLAFKAYSKNSLAFATITIYLRLFPGCTRGEDVVTKDLGPNCEDWIIDASFKERSGDDSNMKKFSHID